MRSRLFVLVSVLVGVLALVAAPSAGAAAVVRLPEPTGGYPVATTSVHLVDQSRVDTWAPTPRPRELMVQTWYPTRSAAGRPRAEYAPTEVTRALEGALGAPRDSLRSITPTAVLDAPILPGRLPVVLVSHGYGGSRATGTALAEDLASHGYLVVGVDHTYEAAAVKFPDGRVITHDRPAEETPEDVAAAITYRARDLSFALTAVSRRWQNSVDPRRVAAIGHSAGGATAFEAARLDGRIRAAADLDGGLSAPVTTEGVPVPALLLTGAWHFDSWTRWRDAQSGWGRHLAADTMGHYSFTDAPFYVAPGGLDQLPAEVYAELFGTVTPARAVRVQRTYVRAFLDRFLRGTPTPLLDCPTRGFPEVTVRWDGR
ncbi:dienelactone hydrolase family protein [Actinokineospora auranticolor]|uniref:Platelet-activating factor acetylhydrolase isoform II n=1 Tax=Actinokineospora auranticolor TaxID=155976 RepID=A0A2S6GYY9_9PSEU|nr:dienelactone hydrolase family protein [Actinokineospora auranticolor]PPK70443.1 platelet-activating factor acetylhydrolase isoform II [Actinokineospora auranticolor]